LKWKALLSKENCTSPVDTLIILITWLLSALISSSGAEEKKEILPFFVKYDWAVQLMQARNNVKTRIAIFFILMILFPVK
jgi:hypothetical protein